MPGLASEVFLLNPEVHFDPHAQTKGESRPPSAHIATMSSTSPRAESNLRPDLVQPALLCAPHFAGSAQPFRSSQLMEDTRLSLSCSGVVFMPLPLPEMLS